MKNYHKMGMIRPEKIYEALLYLKNHHPEYSNINVTDFDEWLNKDPSNDNADSEESSHLSSDESDSGSDVENSNNQEDKSTPKTQSNSDENIFNAVTCLLPDDPLSDVIGKFCHLYIQIYLRGFGRY